MVARDEWEPQGDKSAGQPVSSCAVACSYDPGCTAYHRTPSGCYHGTANTTCTGTTGEYLERGTHGFQRNFSFAAPTFADSGWPAVTLPHDPLINQTFNATAGEGSGFLPRQVVWYRKRFTLPEAFRGQHLFLYFQGAFQFAEIYLNGQHVQDHAVGYTSFTVRLDNASSLAMGSGSANVLAVRVDPSFGSGHWYEGGGINRPVTLVAAPMLHFVQGGVFPDPQSNGTTLAVSVEVEDLTGGSPAQPVTLNLRDQDGQVVATTGITPSPAGVGAAVLRPATPLQTWSPQTPVTYTLIATVGDDVVNITTAARNMSLGKRAHLNGHQIELQGFSHHPSFAGMGAMTNPRLGLFLAQTTKALGVNFWRNSHNPYEDAVYELLTTVGLMCWDENRNFGSSHAAEYHDMVKAHRAHPAVVLWGLCNEGQCRVEDGQAAKLFLGVKNSLDPHRPQTGNFVPGAEFNFPYADVIAESGTYELAAWHEANPTKPITAGEHGFGNNQLWDSRGPEDRGLVRLGDNVSETFSDAVVDGGTGWSNLPPRETVDFLLSSHGLGMWAMVDYFGEAWMGWPTIIKSRGHLDVAGFPRSTAWWFRTNYLANPSVPDYQRPLVGGDWQTQIRALTPCLVLTSAPTVDLFLDGAPRGQFRVNPTFGLLDLRNGSTAWPPQPGPTPANVSLIEQTSPDTAPCSAAAKTFGGYDGLRGMWVDKGCRGVFWCDGNQIECACVGSQGYCLSKHNCSCDQPTCEIAANNVTVVALDATGAATKTHTLLSAGPATKLELVVDVPSPATGTGSSLYLDGQDVAFVRAQLVDRLGTLSRDSDLNVSYSVVSGPIRIVGVGSGSIRNHQPVQGTTYQTWQGLGRVVVQATLDCASEHRALAASIDLDVPENTYAAECPSGPAVLAATAGEWRAEVEIALSSDPKDHPLAVARATRSLDTYTYFDEVQP